MTDETVPTFPAPRESEPALHIAAGIDENYVFPLLVMLLSLRQHLSGPAPVLHLFHRELSGDALEAIEAHASVYPVRIPEELLPPVTGTGFPPEAATPLALADLLPDDLHRVLFLDADLLVLDDVAKLWCRELDDALLAACQDSAIPHCGSSRGVKDLSQWHVDDAAPYFNAGVMLIDLDGWRAEGITPSALEYLRRTGDRVDFLHQEALNAVLGGRWARLHPRWNVPGGLAGRPFERPPSTAWRDPAIVHFAGRMKPWLSCVGGRFGDRYQAMAARVARQFARPVPSPGQRLFHCYDRTLRRFLYPCERRLWEMRIL
jgi:lipopolysaccharide biosynthesis glycosyltransferase